MITKNKRLTGIVLAVALLLLVPFIAMQFTNEVSWTGSDFVTAGVLLLGTGLLCEFVMRKIRNKDYQYGILAVILLTLILTWAELAVGIFGSPLAGS
ncbi:MAG TPA: hypothetical protein VLZ28_07645 [Daejeonella sp.]|nr:hypothetical protein [Daejeonella sp.]